MVHNHNALFAAAHRTARILARLLVGCTIAASCDPFRAQAAEVDANGAPAPIGFADVIERVKPAVVGVRVKVAEAAAADDAQRRPPDAPARKFGAPPSTNGAKRCWSRPPSSIPPTSRQTPIVCSPTAVAERRR